jgi:hypothetical protein
MAMQTARSMSTIRMLRGGHLNPHPVLTKEIAAVLHMSQEDVAAIAGLDEDTTWCGEPGAVHREALRMSLLRPTSAGSVGQECNRTEFGGVLPLDSTFWASSNGEARLR